MNEGQMLEAMNDLKQQYDEREKVITELAHRLYRVRRFMKRDLERNIGTIFLLGDSDDSDDDGKLSDNTIKRKLQDELEYNIREKKRLVKYRFASKCSPSDTVNWSEVVDKFTKPHPKKQ